MELLEDLRRAIEVANWFPGRVFGVVVFPLDQIVVPLYVAADVLYLGL